MRLPYFCYGLCERLSLRLPIRAARRIADAIARASFAVPTAERGAVLNNLRVVLRGAPDKAVEDCALLVYRNFARNVVDVLYRARPGSPPPRVRIENGDAMESARSGGRGVILLSAHMGNWELGAAAVASRWPLSIVAVDHPDPRTNRLFNARREAAGVKVIPTGQAARRCLSALAAGETLGIVGDRRYTPDTVEIPFFGRIAALPKGPAFLSLKSGAPVVAASMLPEGDDFVLRFEEPLRPQDWSESDFVRKTVERLELLIARAPEQWFCFDRVWPAGAVPVGELCR